MVKCYIPNQSERIPRANGSNPNLVLLPLVGVGDSASQILDFFDSVGNTLFPKLEMVALGDGQSWESKGGARKD